MGEAEDRERAERERQQLLAREANMLLFLRAGGRVTLGEWVELPPDKQAHLARAGDQYTAALAVLLGLASQDRAGAAAVFSLVDGGKLEARLSLVDAVREVAARRGGPGV